MIVTTELALAAMSDATQIEMILSVSNCPRWPRQVLSCVTITGVIAIKCCQCKQALEPAWLRKNTVMTLLHDGFTKISIYFKTQAFALEPK